MTSRRQILDRIRRHPLAAAALPDANPPGIVYDDPERQFVETLKFVGGETLIVPAGADVAEQVRRIDYVRAAAQIACLVPSLGLGNLDLSQVTDPHGLAGVDVAIVPGEFAVAENGAVWVSGASLGHRAVCFLTQRLVLVVPRDQLVHNMHQAYARLSFSEAGYGVFISGPSKTADIEQSLVIGAHGSRSLIVVLAG